MKPLRKTYIQRFYNAVKAHQKAETDYEVLKPFQKIKIYRRLKREAKQADEKFEMEIRWFMQCLQANDDTILMDTINMMCYYKVPIEKAYQIFEILGFELVD